MTIDKLSNLNQIENILIQWNPSCEATPFETDKWPFKRGSLLVPT